MPSRKFIKRGSLLVGALALAAGGFFLFNNAQNAGAQAPGGEQPPMPVLVNVMKAEPVMIWNEFSGRLTPVEYALIQPQVSGTITEIKFQDGQTVEKGAVLMVIDPRPFDAALKQAKASLSSAQNALALATTDLKRAQDLITTNAISKRILDERQNTQRTAAAAVESAKAQVQTAEVDLDHAYVKAPISGRVGRAELTVGNVVQSGPNAPTLTSIVSDAGIYADFEVDEQTYLSSVRAGAKDKEEEMMIPVQISVGGDGGEKVEGKIHTFDNHIDPASGTIRARAIFDNEDGALLPGMFVKVNLGSPTAEEKIMVTEKAIGTDQSRKFVYVVDDKNMVKYRQVELGDSTQGRRVVLDGLKEGEKVIAEGIIKIRPDMPVKPMSPEEMEAMQKQQAAEAAKAAEQKPAAGGGH
jgi:multidrug efflux system membrane fusion protein